MLFIAVFTPNSHN